MTFKVLVVSSDAALREQLAALLLKEGVVVDQVASIHGAEARVCEPRCADLLLLDGRDVQEGDEACLRVACRPKRPHVLILLDASAPAPAHRRSGAVTTDTRPRTVHESHRLVTRIAGLRGHGSHQRVG